MPFRKTILISGASSGLGEEMARQFAAKGHDLALCARRLERLEALRAEILAAHPGLRVAIKELDVTNDEQVFEVFAAFQAELGVIDRVIVNAGLGKGAKLGTGRYYANKQTAMTNFVGALAQSEAAMSIFREQAFGHFVMVSSFSALRGLPREMATYAATKAGVAHLTEGLRVELHGTAIGVTVLYPGYIVSEMSEGAAKGNRLMSSTEKGVAAMVSVIEKEKARAYIPRMPWTVLAPVMKRTPIPLFRRMI